MAVLGNIAQAGQEGGKEPVSYTKLLPSRDKHNKETERHAFGSAVIKRKVTAVS